ncbi:MAG: glycoside hydrolase family 44 protein [Akkermansiaceae bacterium]|nr:glycoside hydrolase family 44 protein [Armatimonadota bacterium]
MVTLDLLHRVAVRVAVVPFVLAASQAVYAQNPSTTITVYPSVNRRPIDPRIYGVAYGTAATLAELNSPLNRLGGNNLSRYNWKQNADNRASDYYFESIGGASASPGERGDTFVADTRAANVGAEPMLTIPMIGYVATLGPNRSKTASFLVSRYGAQQSTDYWWRDAGNGVLSNGSLITNNNPLDANVVADSTFQQDWVRHLVGRWGSAANGGVKYYLYDNEHGLWHATHRDVKPTGPKMEEIRDKIIEYGTKIRAVDSRAILVGPEEWGWSGYLYSGYDQQYGNKNGWGYLPDRSSHAGWDYLPWLLDQLKRHQDATGERLLDIFTVHYYPQGGEFGGGTDTAMQLRRNRSTRSLWDPNYKDETWINSQVKLVPRLRQWVDAYYPGTKIGVTEYNWGAESHINGATAQADVLGIFGREGLDIANRWTTPNPTTPTFKAMKMYRNYDGNRGSFGETSVSTVVANPDNVSSFSAVRSSDGALTVMVISKYLSGNTPATIQLSNFNAAAKAQVYQLTSANAITRLADATVTAKTITATLPSQSITLFVVPANPTFNTSASATPNPVSRNTATAIRLNVKDTGGVLTDAIVNMEIYNAAGQKVNQQVTSGQSFGTNQTRTYTYGWTPTVAGNYTVKIGVFNGTWGAMYHWNNGAAVITVQ